MKYARVVAEFYSRPWAIREETLLAMQELIRLQAFAGVKWSDEEIRQRIADSNAQNGHEDKEHSGFSFLEINAGHGGGDMSPGKWYVAGEHGAELIGPKTVSLSVNPLSNHSGTNHSGIEARANGRGKASSGTVALIPIMGIISQRMNLMSQISGSGGSSIEKLTAQFREALNDGNCKAIVFDVDSPGGSVAGVPELAAEIYNARKQKPITAVFNSMAASAAYWLASAAGETVCTPSGQCGSIGVYMIHQDESEALKREGIKVTMIKAGKYKTEGNPSEPLSPEAYDALLSQVNDYYSMFVRAVAQNRGTTQSKVRDGYGQGRVVMAADAVKQNLADRIGTLDDVLEKYGVVGKGGSRLAAAALQANSVDISAPQMQVVTTGNVSTANLGAIVKAADEMDEDDVPMDEKKQCADACEACRAGNCTACTNALCDDMNCEHDPNAKAQNPDGFERDYEAEKTSNGYACWKPISKEVSSEPSANWEKALEQRRRQINLM